MRLLFAIVFGLIVQSCNAQESGILLYSNTLASESELEAWVMEGAGQTEFADGWMRMCSPDEASHHVYWCPLSLPASFIAEWEVSNKHPEAGLCIVFFAAKGQNGQNVLSNELNPRNGIFKQYTKGDINNYHISYYANSPLQKDRPHVHLRKNSGFHKVHVGEAGIPHNSEAIHTIRLVKKQGHIQFFIDGVSVVDWQDDGQQFGPVLGEGYFGFRQMKWTQFEYRNLNIWELPK